MTHRGSSSAVQPSLPSDTMLIDTGPLGSGLVQSAACYETNLEPTQSCKALRGALAVPDSE